MNMNCDTVEWFDCGKRILLDRKIVEVAKEIIVNDDGDPIPELTGQGSPRSFRLTRETAKLTVEAALHWILQDLTISNRQDKVRRFLEEQQVRQKF